MLELDHLGKTGSLLLHRQRPPGRVLHAPPRILRSADHFPPRNHYLCRVWRKEKERRTEQEARSIRRRRRRRQGRDRWRTTNSTCSPCERRQGENVDIALDILVMFSPCFVGSTFVTTVPISQLMQKTSCAVLQSRWILIMDVCWIWCLSRYKESNIHALC